MIIGFGFCDIWKKYLGKCYQPRLKAHSSNFTILDITKNAAQKLFIISLFPVCVS